MINKYVLKHTIFMVSLIAGICILTNSCAQPAITAPDQRIIDGLIYKLNRDLFSEEINEKGSANPDTIDSIINASHSGYRAGHVTYTPDRKFKVFVLEGDDCGSHCEPIYQGYVCDTNAQKLDSLYSLLPVLKIYKLPGNLYLVLGQGVEGGGNFIYDSMAAYVLSAKNGKLTKLPFKALRQQNTTKLIFEGNGLKVSQLQYLTDYKANQQSRLLYFDSKRNRLFFNFGIEHSIISGYFQYSSGVFSQIEYKIRKLKTEVEN